MEKLNSKYIVQKDDFSGLHIIIGKCVFHKELSGNIRNIISGGWWELDEKTKTFTLYGKSEQFGRASLAEVCECVDSKKIYGDRQLIKNLTDEYNFQYKSIGGHLTVL